MKLVLEYLFPSQYLHRTVFDFENLLTLAIGFLFAHLEMADIKDWTNNLDFTDNEIIAEMSTGSSRPLIRLPVCEYRPQSRESLRVSKLPSDKNDETETVPTVGTLQYALRNPSAEELQRKYREHIEEISKGDNIDEDSSKFWHETLQVICHFAENDPIAKSVGIFLSMLS